MSRNGYDYLLVAALAAVAVMGLNYLYFGTNDRAAKIIRRYKNEAGRASRWGTVIVTVYVVGSMLLLFGVGALTLYLSQQRLELLKLG